MKRERKVGSRGRREGKVGLDGWEGVRWRGRDPSWVLPIGGTPLGLRLKEVLLVSFGLFETF